MVRTYAVGIGRLVQDWRKVIVVGVAVAGFGTVGAIAETVTISGSGAPVVVGDPTYPESGVIDGGTELDSIRVHEYNQLRVVALGLGFVSGMVFGALRIRVTI